MNKRNKTEMT